MRCGKSIISIRQLIHQLRAVNREILVIPLKIFTHIRCSGYIYSNILLHDTSHLHLSHNAVSKYHSHIGVHCETEQIMFAIDIPVLTFPDNPLLEQIWTNRSIRHIRTQMFT